MTAPPLPFLAAEHHGKPVVMATLVWAGAVEDGERALAPFRALATPLADLVRPSSYPELFPPIDENHRPIATAYTAFADDVDERAAEAIVAGLEASTAPMRVTQLRVLGGAVARVPEHATAFAHRRSPLMAMVGAMFQDLGQRPEHEAWVAGLAGELGLTGGATYAGFLADDGADRVRAAYPGATWDRLAAVKAAYDPENLFRLNQNVPPAVEEAAA
jgi:hypothetical protein